jgi:hypothetical protein
MATQTEIDIFLKAFYDSWNRSLKDRRAYNFALTVAEAQSGLLVGRALDATGQIVFDRAGLIDPSLVPTFASLTDGLAPVSTAAVVANANLARDENASSQRPSESEQVLTLDGRIAPAGNPSGTNAEKTPTTQSNPTTGTNATTVSTSQSQAVNNQSNRATAGAGQSTADLASGDPRRTDTGGPGAAAAREDNTPPSPSVVVNQLNNLFAENIIQPEPNVLDRYASYTYVLSWYLVDPLVAGKTVSNIKKGLNGYYLLAQSGGINSQAPELGIGTGFDPDLPRNPFFSLDYYIDGLSVHTAYANSDASGGPMKFLTLAFTVSEPNGLTLPKNLYSAVNDVYSRTAKVPNLRANYATGLYCMVIRFYGYNEAGVLDAPITAGSDTGAAVEKFIFFTLTKFDYSLGSKLVEYKIEGAVPETAVGFSSNRGSIPFAQQFVGATVQDILVGQIQQQTAAQPAGDATRNNQPVTPDPADAGPAGAGLGLSGQAIAAERLRLQSIANESSFLNRIRDRL